MKKKRNILITVWICLGIYFLKTFFKRCFFCCCAHWYTVMKSAPPFFPLVLQNSDVNHENGCRTAWLGVHPGRYTVTRGLCISTLRFFYCTSSQRSFFCALQLLLSVFSVLAILTPSPPLPSPLRFSEPQHICTRKDVSTAFNHKCHSTARF